MSKRNCLNKKTPQEEKTFYLVSYGIFFRENSNKLKTEKRRRLRNEPDVYEYWVKYVAVHIRLHVRKYVSQFILIHFDFMT